ncbi:class I adenylate-forming enzyme family protein [Paraburkholderia fungorum]|uniref:class I adenylate-forming enzyme family protein n=1 Tax=Paraburkholderia fungorum TaxID=134537 RepID=UPI0038BD6084
MPGVSDTTERLYVDALLDQLGTQPDKPVLRYRRTDLTGGALRSSIFRYARALEALGIGRGCLVALLAPNCPDALAIRYAANLLGAATLFMPALAKRDQQSALLARIQPTLLVVFGETAHLVPEGVTARVVPVGFGADTLRLDQLAAAHSDLPLHSSAMPNELAVIVSSGGTTGVPKCSRRSFTAYSAMVRAEKAEDRRQLVNGALAYISQILVDSTLIGGGTVVLERQYDPAATLSMIESERITDLLLVEPQLFETMDHPDARWRDLSSLRSIAHIGGSAPAILRQRAIRRFGPVLKHMYGASEAGLVSMLASPRYEATVNLPFSAGRIVDGVEVRIRGADGRLLDVGEIGTIETKSAFVAQGYYRQPEAVSSKFRNGWCLMGDTGFIDEDGNLHVLGRASDVAVIDGVFISPTKIEEVLCWLPDVRYAAAYASANGSAGYTWNALVEPWAGRQLEVARCTGILQSVFGTSVSRRVRIVEVDRVPQTEQGKVDRTAIEAILQDESRLQMAANA